MSVRQPLSIHLRLKKESAPMWMSKACFLLLLVGVPVLFSFLHLRSTKIMNAASEKGKQMGWDRRRRG